MTSVAKEGRVFGAMSKILIRNALVVVTQDENLGELSDVDILIDGNHIAEVKKDIDTADAEVLDASGCIVVPGFVNTHHHLFQVLTRNLVAVQDAKLFDWLVYLYNVWENITVQDVRAASLAGLGELLLTGCTTSSDHHYLCPQDAGGDLFVSAAEAARELGIRFQLTRGSMSLGKSDGGLPPDSVIEDQETILKDSQRVIELLHDPNKYSMCRVSLAPCSPFSVTAELMRETAVLAREHKVRLHTHLAETHDETEYCLERFGKRPLDYIEELDWLDSDCWFAHCVCLNDDEIKRMGQAKAGVAHCPTSNLRLGSGIAPVPAMLAANVPVGLAVDGSASNDSSNMLRELQQALLVHRVGTAVDSMTARMVLKMATLGGAAVLGRDDIGRISPGYAADIAIFDLSGLAYAGSHQDPLASLLFCGIDSRAKNVIVNGNIVVKDKELCSVDQKLVNQQARQAAIRLLDQ
jgi:cytosine/adenosine deaminase-related metal-dependent hydrolase